MADDPASAKRPTPSSAASNGDERVPSSHALRSWFRDEAAVQRHLEQLRAQEKMVNGIYVPSPDLHPHANACNPDDYPND